MTATGEALLPSALLHFARAETRGLDRDRRADVECSQAREHLRTGASSPSIAVLEFFSSRRFWNVPPSPCAYRQESQTINHKRHECFKP